MFWQGTDTAFFLEDRRGSPLAPDFGTKSVGARGPMPQIEEDASVTFNDQLKHALQIGRLKEDYVSIYHVVGSRDQGKFKGNTVGYKRYEWDETGQVVSNMWGGEYKLTAIREEDGKPKAVEIEVVKEPLVEQLRGNKLTPAQIEMLRSILESRSN